MNEALIKYAEMLSKDEDVILNKLNRETHIKHIHPRMLSGHLQGKFLEMISCIYNPEKILEIGTYTGYSAICLAKGLKNAGVLHTIEIDPELEEIAKKYFSLSGFEKSIIMHIGDAMDVINTMDEIFDIVFIDGDKENYPEYYKLLYNRVKTGGLIIADNVLWGGKVVNEPAANDKETKGIIEFNELVKNDKRVENFLLPFRDGIMICRKL
jgi:predicted O-methyltransferase YrrM